MNQSKRGPAILIVAGMFLLFAIVAYLVGDAESNNERHAAILRETDILRVQNEQSIADRAALHEQTTRFAASRAELCRQKKVTVELLRRVDDLTAEVAAQRTRVENCDCSRKEQADHK
jgi:hypothetical protein